MPAFNHTADDLSSTTKHRISHSGEIKCLKCGTHVGKQTKLLQEHYEDVHGYDFSKSNPAPSNNSKSMTELLSSPVIGAVVLFWIVVFFLVFVVL